MDDSTLEPSLNRRVAAGFRAELARTEMPFDVLARHLGISVTSLRRRMRDEVSFTVWEVEAGCQLFGVDLIELVRASLALKAIRVTADEVVIERGARVVERR